MEEFEIKQGKRNFISQLYQYKLKEELLLDCMKGLEIIIDDLHKLGLALDMNINGTDRIIENKYNLLIGAFLRSEMDLVFFSDEGELYPANFFAGRILEHFILKIDDINKAIEKFDEETLTFGERIESIVRKHRIKYYINAFTGRNFYNNDDIARTSMEEMQRNFKEVESLFEEFYREDPFHNYLDMVEYSLRKSLENIEGEDKAKLEQNMVTFYEIDADFLRVIGKSKEISRLRKIYLKYMGEAGLNTDILVPAPEKKYFTPKRHDLFDPTMYLRMSTQELSRTVFEEEMQSAGNIYEDKEAFSELKKTLEGVGIKLLDPLAITEENIIADIEEILRKEGIKRK